MGLANIATLERKVASQLTLANLGLSPLPMLHRRYRIEEIRGRGARGLVVRAVDTAIGRMVALKIYPPLDDPRLDREVVREAHALGRLEHPNVVRIYDVGQAELTLETESMTVRFMCIEYIEGKSLRAWASEKKRRRKHVIRALLSAAEGLAAAHAAGIVHRDVKPDNIMVDGTGAIKVVDFGLARGLHAPGVDNYAPGQSSADPWATATGAVIGTPEYMAPEARHGRAFAEADQYSFAMAAWELLLGFRPYDSSNEDYKPPGQATFSGATHLPGYLRAPLERALDFNPSGRHRNMEALVSAIRRGQSLRRLGVVAGVTGTAVASAGLGVALWQGEFELPGTEGPAAAAARDTKASRDPAPKKEDKAPRPHESSSPEPARASKRLSTTVTAPSNAEVCDGVGGLWVFNTAVSWANNMQFRGINGYYELELEHRGRCRFDATVRKTGSTRHVNSPAEVSTALARVDARVVDGRVQLWSKFRLVSRRSDPREYMFAFEIDGRENVVGAYWHRASGTTSHDIAGVLRGGQSRPSRDLSASEVEVPCPFECIPGCADDASTQACVERCGDGRPAMPCGAPTDVWSAPARAREVIDRTGSVLSSDMSGAARRRCEKTARWLEGEWTLYVVGEPTRDFRISASDCQLTFSGEISGTGDVDGRGAWTRLVSNGMDILGNARLAPDFALAGWGPAFGLTSDRKPAAAFRRSQ